MKHCILSIFVVLAILSAGCAMQTYRQAGDGALPAGSIAVLEHPDPQGSKFVIENIDGEFRGFGLYDRYELKPGVREITYWWRRLIPDPSDGKHKIYLLAESGQTYLIEAVEIPDMKDHVAIAIRNKHTGKVVSGYGATDD